MNLNDLYNYAINEDIVVFDHKAPVTISVSIMTDTGNCYIGIDYNAIKSEVQERERLAHEVGHCVRGAFYNRYSLLDLKSKHEYRADKWAIERLLPKEEMAEAFEYGIVEVWELAEYFEVSEEFIKKAAYIYFDKYIP